MVDPRPSQVATRLTWQLLLAVLTVCVAVAVCLCTWRRMRTCCVRAALRLKVYIWLKCALLCGCCCVGPAATKESRAHRGMLRLASGDEDDDRRAWCQWCQCAGHANGRVDASSRNDASGAGRGNSCCERVPWLPRLPSSLGLALTWVASACRGLRSGYCHRLCYCHRLLAIYGCGVHASGSRRFTERFAGCFACCGRMCRRRCAELCSKLCFCWASRDAAAGTTSSRLASRGSKLATLEPVEPDGAEPFDLDLPSSGPSSSLPRTSSTGFRLQRPTAEPAAHQVLYGRAFLARVQALQSNGHSGARRMDSDFGGSPPASSRAPVSIEGRPKPPAICYPPIEFDL